MPERESCFHIKKLDNDLLRHITDALEIGYKAYQEKGWV